MAALFEPYTLKDVTLRNRIAIPPMCQYMANDGIVNDWHHVHLASMARGGAGLLVVEATAVSPEGRITPGCAGIWSDAHAQAFVPMVKAIKAAGAVPGIQIAHAGRKASANRPWEGDDHMPASDARSWETLAPSAIAFGANLPNVPRAMTLDDIAHVRQDFVDAARRARDAGFEWIELHFAHGYLAQSFFSEHSNQRTDAYGGSFDNRSRFLLETLAAVREVWPENLPLTARFGVIEYDGPTRWIRSGSARHGRRIRSRRNARSTAGFPARLHAQQPGFPGGNGCDYRSCRRRHRYAGWNARRKSSGPGSRGQSAVRSIQNRRRGHGGRRRRNPGARERCRPGSWRAAR